MHLLPVIAGVNGQRQRVLCRVAASRLFAPAPVGRADIDERPAERPCTYHRARVRRRSPHRDAPAGEPGGLAGFAARFYQEHACYRPLSPLITVRV